MRYAKMEPWEVLDKVEKLSKVCGVLESCKAFSPPHVARSLGDCQAWIDGVVADLGKLLEEDEG